MFPKKTGNSSILKNSLDSNAEGESCQNNLKKGRDYSDFAVLDTRFEYTHCCKCCRRSVELSTSEAEKICNADPIFISF